VHRVEDSLSASEGGGGMMGHPSYGGMMNVYGNPYYGNVAGSAHKQQYGHNNNNNKYSSSSSTYDFNDGPTVACELSDWGPWSKCSVDCGRGHKYRTRYIKVTK
jgi:hypothetical protein